MAASSLDVELHSQLQGECLVFLVLPFHFLSLAHILTGPQVTQVWVFYCPQEAKSHWPLYHWEDLLASLGSILTLVNGLAQVCYQVKRRFWARTQRIWDHPHSWKITLTLRWLSHAQSRKWDQIPLSRTQRKREVSESLLLCEGHKHKNDKEKI